MFATLGSLSSVTMNSPGMMVGSILYAIDSLPHKGLSEPRPGRCHLVLILQCHVPASNRFLPQSGADALALTPGVNPNVHVTRLLPHTVDELLVKVVQDSANVAPLIPKQETVNDALVAALGNRSFHIGDT